MDREIRSVDYVWEFRFLVNDLFRQRTSRRIESIPERRMSRYFISPTIGHVRLLREPDPVTVGD